MIVVEQPRHDRRAKLVAAIAGRGRDLRSEVLTVSAPLRICPLGAHVDHQGGVVTGLAVNRSVDMAAVATSGSRLEVSSLDFLGTVVVDLHNPDPSLAGDWGDYARAAASVVASRHPLTTGLRAVIAGDLPGAGLSSSAAVLVAYFMVIAAINGIEPDRQTLAAWVQEAENDYLGVASGRLDQSIILNAVPEHLTRVDCSHLDIEQIPLARDHPDVSWVVAFSGRTRRLAGSGFNTRVEECRQAAAQLLHFGGGKVRRDAVLADVDRQIFDRFEDRLEGSLRRRARHYFSEQERVVAGVEAWRAGDLREFGRLMTASGASSVENYECGTLETVDLWEILQASLGVLGTRFSGGGFGGSVVALVDRSYIDSVFESVARRYRTAHPEAAAEASFHVCETVGAAHLCRVNA